MIAFRDVKWVRGGVELNWGQDGCEQVEMLAIIFLSRARKDLLIIMTTWNFGIHFCKAHFLFGGKLVYQNFDHTQLLILFSFNIKLISPIVIDNTPIHLLYFVVFVPPKKGVEAGTFNIPFSEKELSRHCPKICLRLFLFQNVACSMDCWHRKFISCLHLYLRLIIGH